MHKTLIKSKIANVLDVQKECKLDLPTNKWVENLDIIPLPMMIITGSGSVVSANSASQDLFSSSDKVLKRSNLFEIVKPSAVIKSLIERAIDTGVSASALEVNLLGPNLVELEADIMVSPTNVDGQLSLIFWPRNTASGLNSQRNANEKDKSFGQIGRALAHEVKNPLAGIRGAAQLLMLDANENQKPLAKLIIEETDRVHRLMDRVESLGLDTKVPLKPLNIHSILERVVQLAENGFAADLNISRQFDVSLPNIMGEPDRLTQIFLNLAKNAAEAAKEKGSAGQIIFSTAYRHGQKLRRGEGESSLLPIEIAISDNGFGISDELRNFVFDPFVTTKAEGSGLGLALVRKMVAAHNGVVEFESQPGRTIFKVRLPRAPTDIGEIF